MRFAKRLAVGAALLLFLGGCAGGGGPGAGCVGYADNPHISEPSHTIVAKSRTYCEGVTSATITMHLLRKQGAGWSNVRADTATIRSPQDNAKNVRQVVAPCVSGTYRHEVIPSAIIGMTGVPIPIQNPEDRSQEVSINC